MYKQDAFYLGESFHKVAADLIENNFLKDSDEGFWFVPSIVNMSFACELYLKSLCSDGESEIWGHWLNDLFNELSDEVKEKIRNSAPFRGDERFESNLIEHGKLFETWRYCFEKEENCCVDVIFLENFAMVLHEIAKEELNHG